MEDRGLATEHTTEEHDAELLHGLTDAQRRAVLHTEGPLLVLAAAGSGKTRVITRRIAHLVRLGVAPWSILALTFTNKAAGEMRQRVHALLADDERLTRGLTVTTFHALCARLLRRYADAVPGLKPDYSIYDSDDQQALLKRVLASLNLSTSNWPPSSVLSAISNAKNALQDASTFAASAHDFYSRSLAKIYSAYEHALRQAGAVDFDDLLLLTAKALRDQAVVRDDCRRRWSYLLIDEYQDTNRAQFVIASTIAGEDPKLTPGAARVPNICVVGDPDQAIYGWRGADISNILDFEERYPSAAVIPLGQNFRSTAPILAVADALIRHNQRRKHKDLFTTEAGGERVEVWLCRDEHHEAATVVDWLRHLHESGPLAWKDMAVFYRTNALSRVIEDALRQAGLPYVIARGTAFYQREEIRNALAYLRVLANPADDVSLARIVNVPARGLGDASLDRVSAVAGEQQTPMLEALRAADSIEGVSPRARNAARAFVEMLDAWTGAGSFMGADTPGSLTDLVERVVKESGLEAMYRKQAAASQSDADAARLDNLAELVSSAAEFEREYDPAGDPALDAPADPLALDTPPLLAMLRAYLESVSLVADADAVDPSQGAVTLMTLHAAKGLEFGAVAMIGLEEGVLPHSRAQQSDAELEEERRLCFVGITRAMKRLRLSSAKYRTIRGVSERTIPSRFLDELDPRHTRITDMSDAYDADPSWDDAPTALDRPGAGPAGRGAPPPGAASGAARQFPVGCTVRHPQFGLGRVQAVTSGANARAQIAFQGLGVKTLVLEYARLQRVD